MDACALFKVIPLPAAMEMLDHAYHHGKPLYRELINSLAQVRRTRPPVVLKTPRAERHPWMIAMLQQPPSLHLAYQVVSDWLLGTQQPMLRKFLDTLGIPHDGTGCVQSLGTPPDPAPLRNAVNLLLDEFPAAHVAIYLRAFNTMPEAGWKALDELLAADPRLELKPVLPQPA